MNLMSSIGFRRVTAMEMRKTEADAASEWSSPC
jgi:hypothetical protein